MQQDPPARAGLLTRYALFLTEHPEEAERFVSDIAFARAAMNNFGLDDEQQAILLSRDMRRVFEALRREEHELLGLPPPTYFPMESKTHTMATDVFRRASETPRSPGCPLPGATARLWIVGTGMRVIAQTSPEARYQLRRADIVFFVLEDPLARAWLRTINASTFDCIAFYAEDKLRSETYEQIVEAVGKAVNDGLRVAYVTGGHAGFFSYAAHKLLDDFGSAATMLPAISSQDSALTDLNIDPGDRGLQTYEATYFLRTQPPFDATSELMLLQIGAIDVFDAKPSTEIWNPRGLSVLADALAATYGPEHRVAIYDASRYIFTSPIIVWTTLGELIAAPTQAALMSTLYVPSAVESPVPARS